MFPIVFSRYNLILCRIFSRYLRHSRNIYTLLFVTNNLTFTLTLLQEFYIFTLVL